MDIKHPVPLPNAYIKQCLLLAQTPIQYTKIDHQELKSFAFNILSNEIQKRPEFEY